MRGISTAPLATPTMTGTSVSVASTLEKNRSRQMSQYPTVPQALRSTNQASRNEDNPTATSVASTRMLYRRKLSKRAGPGLSHRISPAPISESTLLLTNQLRTIGTGMPAFSSTKRCAGNAASNTAHHRRGGASSRMAIMTAFGGHSVETGAGRKVSAMPTSAATKYAAPISRPIAAGRTSSAMGRPREVCSAGLDTASDMMAGVSAGADTAPGRHGPRSAGVGQNIRSRGLPVKET